MKVEFVKGKATKRLLNTHYKSIYKENNQSFMIILKIQSQFTVSDFKLVNTIIYSCLKSSPVYRLIIVNVPLFL